MKKGFFEKRIVGFAIALFLILSLLGCNNYFAPKYFDNIFYFYLAESLSQGGSYEIMDQMVVDWPPMYPLVLAAFFSLFGSSLLLGKCITALLGAGALYAAYRLCLMEQREPAKIILIIMALLPTSLKMSITLSSDWQYTFFSLLFLITLHQLSKQRNLYLASLSGLLLGIAALTRYTGVFLGAAIIFQVILQIRKRQSIIPEIVCTLIGASLFLSWAACAFYWIQDPSTTVYQGNYANEGLTLFQQADFPQLGVTILDLFLQWDNLLEVAGPYRPFIQWIAILPLGCLTAGLIYHLSPRRVRPSDLYVLAVLLLYLTYQWKLSRFILCLSPFLLSYLFTGAKLLLRPQLFRKLLVPGVALWCASLFLTNLLLLFYGNLRTQGAFSPIVATSPEIYYRNYWKEFYHLAQKAKEISQNQPLRLGVTGAATDGYIYFFGWTQLFLVSPEKADLLVTDNDTPPPDLAAYQLITKEKNYSLWNKRAQKGKIVGLD